MSRTAHVIHHFFAAILLKRFTNARAESLQHFVPRSPRPFPTAARAGTLHRIKDAIGIMNLRNRRRPLRAKTTAARRVLGIAFKLCDLTCFFIDVGKKSARRFAVKTDGRNKLEMFFDAPRPCCGIELDPVVPLLDRRIRREVTAVALEIGHCSISVLRGLASCSGRFVQPSRSTIQKLKVQPKPERSRLRLRCGSAHPATDQPTKAAAE